jgi:PAS domain S-box-containing protein
MNRLNTDKAGLYADPLTGMDPSVSKGEFLFDAKSRLLLDSVPSAIAYISKHQQIQFVNKAFENIFQVKKETVVGTQVVDFLGPEANQEVKSYREEVLAGKPSRFEKEVHFKDFTRWIEASYTPDFDEDGKVAGYILLLNDITGKKSAFLETERRYKELLDSLPVAVYTCDKDGYIRLFNKASVELWGRTPDIGKDKWCGSSRIFETDGVTPIALDTCPMAIAIKEGRAVLGKEILVEQADGNRKLIQPHPTPLFDIDGNLAGAINMLMDMTEKKEAEKKLAYLAAIVHSSNDPIISKTLDGVITSWNEAAVRVFGYEEKEMVGQHITKIIPEERRSEEDLILERLKKGTPVEHFETKRLTKDKRLIDVSLTSSPVKDNDGNTIGASKIVRDITAQKKLYEALRESEERLSLAIRTTQLGTWDFYPLTNQLTWSDECRKIYGVPAGMEVDFEFFSKHIHPDDEEMVQEAITEAMEPEKGGEYDLQYRIIRFSDRQPRWIHAQGKIYFNAYRQAERFIGTVVDITEQKTREQELQSSIDLFTTMADNVPAMIWMSGNDTYNDFFNKTWLEYTGRTLEQESKEGWLENVHPEDVKHCINGYNQAFQEQKGHYTEYRLRRHDGEYRWIADNSVARYNRDGSFAGFISACIDIDDQKNAREKILASELWFKTISNVAPVGLWMTDAAAQNVFVNDIWIEWTGIPFKEQLGTGWLARVVEEDRIVAPAKFRECMEKREKYSTEFRIVRPNGELRWCLTEGSPYYGIDGQFAGYAGSVTDITDIRKMEERKDDFIKMASHELKTPITSIKGYVQLLLNIFDELNEEKLRAARPMVRSSLQTISKQVSKLTRLVSELLDLSRIESGKLELYQSSFELGPLVEETVLDVQLTTTQHTIRIHNNFEGNIYADRDRIGQVLMNLLTNAIKYSPDADCVEIFVTGDRNNVRIRVKDYGIGIDKKDYSRIFERFYRVEGKSEQTYPGFGIGLFIAMEIMQRHGGTIEVTSIKNQGTEFTISLPVRTQK